MDSLPIADVTRDILVRKMVDRELSQLYGKHVCHATDEVLLEVKGLTLDQPRPHQAKVKDIDFTLHQGEVLGFFGLIGAGRTEIMEMIFGMRAFTGTIASTASRSRSASRPTPSRTASASSPRTARSRAWCSA